MALESPLNRRAALMFGGGTALAAIPAGAAEDDEALRAELGRVLEAFSRRVHDRDPTALDLFATDNCLLVGSSAGEISVGREAIRRHLAKTFAMPVRVSFAWRRALAGREGAQAAWMWSEGELVLTSDRGGVRRSPYRLASVFVRSGADWRIRLFSGSEPTASR